MKKNTPMLTLALAATAVFFSVSTTPGSAATTHSVYSTEVSTEFFKKKGDKKECNTGERRKPTLKPYWKRKLNI